MTKTSPMTVATLFYDDDADQYRLVWPDWLFEGELVVAHRDYFRVFDLLSGAGLAMTMGLSEEPKFIDDLEAELEGETKDDPACRLLLDGEPLVEVARRRAQAAA